MFSKDTLARLSHLNRGRGPSSASDKPADRPALDPARPRASPDSVLSDAEVDGEHLSQLPRGEEIRNAYGVHWMRRRWFCDIWPHGEHWLNHHAVRKDASRGQPARNGAPDLHALASHLPDHVLYLDLETCGFSGSMVFLIGLLHRRAGQFELAQLMARHYAEEKAMLQTLWTIVAENRVLATFNGKSFDWPMVHDRSTLHRLGRPQEMGCREQHTGNVAALPLPRPQLGPGDPRPELHHCDLLHHNALDLITLLQLSMLLAPAVSDS